MKAANTSALFNIKVSVANILKWLVPLGPLVVAVESLQTAFFAHKVTTHAQSKSTVVSKEHRSVILLTQF